MRRAQRHWSQFARGTLLLAIFGLSSMAAAARPSPAQKKPSSAPAEQESKDAEGVRSELFELMWPTAKLTRAIGADPTLLADEAYLSRNNPELAEFLRNHPEVVRNPEFYLFFPPDFPSNGGIAVATVWSELHGWDPPQNDARMEEERRIAFLVFVLILGALLWIFRIVLENRKWNRLSKMQNELYNKLLDKCGTNEELLASFRSATGKPSFDLATIESRSASPLSRVFLPLQLGIVLTLAGGGLLSFLYSRAGDARLFLGLGTLVFMVGMGLIISAVVSYLLARHLGLLPKPSNGNEASANTTPNR